MLRKFLDGLDERTGYRALLAEALEEKIPGGASWAYVFGSAALVLFGVQLLTGVVLATYYSPSASDAWASVVYLEQNITFGAVLRGIHHHGASGMVVIVGLHMMQTALYGAYKKPREANWLSGLALFGLVLAFALTGYLLPWDQTGYWATRVATGIMGTLPLFGEALQRIAQGGNAYGNLTLTRFYAIHVVVLPLLTLGLIGAHLMLFRRHGVTPSAKKTEEELKTVELFWPKQVAFDAIVSAVLVGIIVYVATTKGAPLEAPADPASNFIARPEWYFLFLFQLLKYTQGPLQIVGTVIIPGLAAGYLAMLPFLDRGSSRAIAARKVWVGALAAGLVAVGVLTVLAVLHDAADPSLAEQRAVAKREATRARELAKAGVPVQGATFMMLHDPLTRGERVFWRECASCHRLEGRGPDKAEAPELTGYRSKAWIRQVLRDPDSPRLFGATKVKGMESYHQIGEKNLTTLVDALYGLREKGAPPIEEGPAADLLEEHECGNCHDFEEASGLDGPALFEYLSKTWVTQAVEHPEAEHLYGQMNTMPTFADRLGAEDRAAVVVFLLSLEQRGDPAAWPHKDDAGPVPSVRTSTAP